MLCCGCCFAYMWFYSLVVSKVNFESKSLSSNLNKTFESIFCTVLHFAHSTLWVRRCLQVIETLCLNYRKILYMDILGCLLVLCVSILGCIANHIPVVDANVLEG